MAVLTENEVAAKFAAEVPFQLPQVRVFRRNIVNADVERNGRHFRARAGIKGQADYYAIVDGGGHIEIETKAAKGRMLDEQKAWRALMISMRVPHLVLRILPNEHPDATVDRWIRALRDVVAGRST